MRMGKSNLGRASLLSGLVILTITFGVGDSVYAQAVQTGAIYNNGVLTHNGVIKGVKPGARISIFDASTGGPVYTTVAGNRGAFSYSIEIPEIKVPCVLDVQSGKSKSRVNVGGSIDQACNQAKTCLTGGSSTEICAEPSSSLRQAMACSVTASKASVAVNAPVNLRAQILPVNANISASWDWGNGSPAVVATMKRGVSTSRVVYSQPGLYTATFTTSQGGEMQCKQSVVIAVSAITRGVPKKVREQIAPKPASAMIGEYVVLPFNEKSEVGVGTTSVPFNPYVQTQHLNALVYQKDPKKPVIQQLDDVEVFYSAASNPKDPVGKGSINSTSQNWFSDKTAGANFNSGVENAFSRTATVTELLDGKHYDGPQTNGIKKTGLYDRRSNRSNNGGSDMTRLTSNPASLLTQLDEGARSTLDLMAETRSMPGKAGAYSRNDEQKIQAFNDMGFFSAQMLPITGVDDLGRKNPFPLMRVVAKQGGQRLAAADAAVTSSGELSCAQCHSKGGISANDDNWFTPVTKTDPEAKGDGSRLGVNSGSSYPNPSDVIWSPAIQNRFELKIVSTDGGVNTYQMVNPLNPSAANLRVTGVGFNQDEAFKPIFVKKDGVDYISDVTGQPMILRGDRVKAYQFNEDGKLQIQLNFVAPDNNSQQAKEKAALLNMAIMHDYYDSFGPASNAAISGQTVPFATQFADVSEDKTTANNANPATCGGHHFSNAFQDVGRGSAYNATFQYSQYSRTMHAFHGRMQVYKDDVTAEQSADGMAHKKGDLIRDIRGHHIPFGGAGWDPEQKDDFKATLGNSYDGRRNNFDPVQFPMHPQGELMLPFEIQGKKADMTENCSVCHAGKTEKVYHDIHYSAGLSCENCHGDMQSVGGLWPFKDKQLTDKHAFRKSDYDQPDCGSCHFGDNSTAGRLAYEEGDKAATPKAVLADSIQQRFAVMPRTEEIKRPGVAGRPANSDGIAVDKLCLGTDECSDERIDNNGQLVQIAALPLFRKSVDSHGNVPCSVCHGSAHTTWPITDTNANHNVTAKQLQGYDGTLMECDVCHSKDGKENSFADGMLASNEAVAYGKRGVLVAASDERGFLGGPHGLHPVNDPNWFSDAPQDPEKTPGGWHSVSAKIPGPDGEDQCAACHGDDHESANRLAKTQVARVFRNMIVEGKRKTVRIPAGQPVNCTDCHTKEISFRGTPWENNHP